MNITITTPVIPRISMRLCKLQASQSRHFSTSRFLYKTTRSRNLPQQQAPPPPQENTAIPPQNTRPAETRPPKQTGPKRDTASSVLFWIGGVGAIYAGWRLNERFWRDDVGARVGV
ncbi:uncharacterized protein RAG0_13952 [Rhynchosporium agropyri]|uniref:Uncharacterized protein n=1 Tax=Rhynchosporium agropyri TaxID=914238 RepID=A0A1E1LEY5_9HELO|nr:uncharacterized protein RAG0_13952 [Rhynchosporium agropyri]